MPSGDVVAGRVNLSNARGLETEPLEIAKLQGRLEGITYSCEFQVRVSFWEGDLWMYTESPWLGLKG